MKRICLLLMTVLWVMSCNDHAIENPVTDYELLTTDYIETSDLFNGSSCFSSSPLMSSSTRIVIRDQAEYDALADSLRRTNSVTDCDTATLMDIDFSKYSLLGRMTAYGACDTILKDITVDEPLKTVTYNIDIKPFNGMCIDVLITSLNLVMVNKIPDNYQVEFR